MRAGNITGCAQRRDVRLFSTDRVGVTAQRQRQARPAVNSQGLRAKMHSLDMTQHRIPPRIHLAARRTTALRWIEECGDLTLVERTIDRAQICLTLRRASILNRSAKSCLIELDAVLCYCKVLFLRVL